MIVAPATTPAMSQLCAPRAMVQAVKDISLCVIFVMGRAIRRSPGTVGFVILAKEMGNVFGFRIVFAIVGG